ncbi:hypothetical protein B0H14DRAFT_2569534 [Mycena olivaceomarginata]|nr:hypothetical protein B0H14DRAFT_2569534 [Mycena olivaceomarginata]
MFKEEDIPNAPANDVIAGLGWPAISSGYIIERICEKKDIGDKPLDDSLGPLEASSREGGRGRGDVARVQPTPAVVSDSTSASKEVQRDQTTNIHGGEIGQRKSKMGRRKPKKSEWWALRSHRRASKSEGARWDATTSTSVEVRGARWDRTARHQGQRSAGEIQRRALSSEEGGGIEPPGVEQSLAVRSNRCALKSEGRGGMQRPAWKSEQRDEIEWPGVELRGGRWDRTATCPSSGQWDRTATRQGAARSERVARSNWRSGLPAGRSG